MELIRRLERRLSKNGKNLESWAIFWCDGCKQEVERRISGGYKAKSCGCIHNKFVSNFHKGKKKTEGHVQKISKALKGKKKSEKHKQKIAEILRGRTGVKSPNFGKKRTEEQKQKNSESHIGQKAWNKGLTSKTDKRILNGKDNPNWNNGSSFEPYGIEFNKPLKQSILERDNCKCQNPECKIEHPKRLDVHHIDFNKKNNDQKNLIILCNSCHSKTIGKNKRQYWTEFYQKIVEEVKNVRRT